MRTTIWVVAALLVGLVLGSWGPRSDLRRIEREIADLKKAGRFGAFRGAEIQGVRQFFNLPGNSEVRRRAAQRAKALAPAPAEAVQPGEQPAGTQAVGGVNADAPATTGRQDRAEMKSGIEQAARLWNTRAALARNSLVSNLKLDSERTRQFDTLVMAMNLRLETGVSNWVQRVRVKGEVGPEDGVRLMHDLSGAVVVTYDELDRTMPVAWRDKAGDRFSVIDFVDPAVAAPLIEIEDLVKRRGDGAIHSASEADGGPDADGSFSFSIGAPSGEGHTHQPGGSHP